MTPEALVKKDIKVFLSSIEGLWFFMPVPTGFGVRGIPDFIGCWRGRFFGIEAKSSEGKPTAWQEAIGRKITLAGGLWLVVRNVDEIKHVFC